MKHRFKAKCDICFKWTQFYSTYKNKLYCDECFKNIEKVNEKIESEKPIQISMFDDEYEKK